MTKVSRTLRYFLKDLVLFTEYSQNPSEKSDVFLELDDKTPEINHHKFMTTPAVEPLKVGFLHEGLFPDGDVFRQTLGRAIELRFDEALARGEVDRPIELIEASGRGLPFGTAKAVQDAWLQLADAGALVILGPGKTDNAIAVKPLFEEFGIPTINFPGTTKSRGEYGFHYQLGALYEDGPILVRAIKAQGFGTVAVVRDKSPVGNEFFEYFADACDREGITILADAKCSPIATDFVDQANIVKKSGAEALVYLGYGQVLVPLTRAIRAASVTIPRFTTTAGLHFYSKSPEEKAVLAGWIYVDMVDEDNKVLQHMATEIQRRWGLESASTMFGCLYDMATLAALGLSYATVYTPEGVKEGLDLVHHIPSALGGQGTVMGFGPHERTALKGPDYLLLRQMTEETTVRYRGSAIAP